MITQKILARTDSLKLDKIISRYGEDSMRQVVFIVVRPEPDSEDLIPITIPEDAVGSFRILKPSGNFVIVPMSKSVLASGETAFDVVLPASANTAKGSGYYDIRITSDTDKYYFTAQGDFLIDDNIISDEALEDVSEVNGLIFPDDFLTVEDHVAIIDDDTVSTDSTWSSNKINEEIEAHAGGDVSKTVSANPVIFTDGAAAPLVKCVTAIQGNQDLHGYSKPWVGGAGKNKLPLTLDEIKTINTIGTWNGNVYDRGGVLFTIMTDDGGNVTGIKTKGISTVLIVFALYDSANFGSSPLVLNGCPANGSDNTYQIQMYNVTDSTYAGLGGDYGDGFTFIPDSSKSYRSEIVIRGNQNLDDKIFYPMIRLATETDPTFQPYSNICPITAYTEGEIEVSDGDGNVTTHTTTYPSAIYRGSEDVVNGTATTEWGMIASYAGETLPGEWISDRNEYAPGTTPTTGAQVAYELATPTTSSVTPTNLPIKSLSGYNHIESSTGEMEVEYITERFQPLIDSIKQL